MRVAAKSSPVPLRQFCELVEARRTTSPGGLRSHRPSTFVSWPIPRNCEYLRVPPHHLRRPLNECSPYSEVPQAPCGSWTSQLCLCHRNEHGASLRWLVTKVPDRTRNSSLPLWRRHHFPWLRAASTYALLVTLDVRANSTAAVVAQRTKFDPQSFFSMLQHRRLFAGHRDQVARIRWVAQCQKCLRSANRMYLNFENPVKCERNSTTASICSHRSRGIRRRELRTPLNGCGVSLRQPRSQPLSPALVVARVNGALCARGY